MDLKTLKYLEKKVQEANKLRETLRDTEDNLRYLYNAKERGTNVAVHVGGQQWIYVEPYALDYFIKAFEKQRNVLTDRFAEL